MDTTWSRFVSSFHIFLKNLNYMDMFIFKRFSLISPTFYSSLTFYSSCLCLFFVLLLTWHTPPFPGLASVHQALGMLLWHKHDVERSLADLANFTPFPDEWTVEDKVLFEQAFSFHGKSFHRIQQMVRNLQNNTHPASTFSTGITVVIRNIFNI